MSIASRALRGGSVFPVGGWLSGRLVCAGNLAWLELCAAAHVAANWPVLLGSGLLVGVGTHLAAGCTSGHGVQHESQPVARSLVATLLFMGAAIGVRFVAGHVCYEVFRTGCRSFWGFVRRWPDSLRHDQSANVRAFLDIAGSGTRPRRW